MPKYIALFDLASTSGPRHEKVVGGEEAAFKYEAKGVQQAQRIAQRIIKTYYSTRRVAKPYHSGRYAPVRVPLQFDIRYVHAKVKRVEIAENFSERTPVLPLSRRNIADLVR